MWPSLGEIRHNSAVNHRTQGLTASPLVVFAPPWYGGRRWDNGPLPKTPKTFMSSRRQPVVTTVILCHWLNGCSRDLEGVPASRRSGTTAEGARQKWMNTPWAALSLMSTDGGRRRERHLLLAATERYYLLCGSIGQERFLKAAAGWVVWKEV